MKTLLKLMVVVFLASGCATYIGTEHRAQPPAWAHSWHADIHYYYFPDWGLYYDVYRARWVHYNGIFWVYSVDRPAWCRSYSLRHSHRVSLRHPGYKPWHRHGEFRKRYPPRSGKAYHGPPHPTHTTPGHRDHSRGRQGRPHPKTRDSHSPKRHEGVRTHPKQDQRESPSKGRSHKGQNHSRSKGQKGGGRSHR